MKTAKNKKDRWFIAEKAEITHYLFAASTLRKMTCAIKDFGFPNFKEVGTEYIKDGGNYVFNKLEWEELARKYF